MNITQNLAFMLVYISLIFYSLVNISIKIGVHLSHSRQVAHVYYQLFDSKMADGDQLWSVPKLEYDLLRRNASTNVRKTDSIERYILHRKPKNFLNTEYTPNKWIMNITQRQLICHANTLLRKQRTSVTRFQIVSVFSYHRHFFHSKNVCPLLFLTKEEEVFLIKEEDFSFHFKHIL
jgi:hypothetical protein